MRLWPMTFLYLLAWVVLFVVLERFPRVTLPGAQLRAACAAPATALDADICAENR